MTQEPGGVRKITDFIGLTESRAHQASHPAVSRKRWIYVAGCAVATGVFVLLALLILDLTGMTP